MTSIPSWARVGAKVVCVDASPRDVFKGLLVAREVYTIRDVVPYAVSGRIRGYVGLRLCEVVRSGPDTPYNIDRFRPLITQQDDMEAHFNALLDAPADEREAA